MNLLAETVGDLLMLAVGCGFAVGKVTWSRAGSVYVRLRRLNGRGWVIRVSNHACRHAGDSLHQVRVDKPNIPGFREAVKAMLYHSTLAGGLDSLRVSSADRVPASSAVLPNGQDLCQGIGAWRSRWKRLYHHAMKRRFVRGSRKELGTFGAAAVAALPGKDAGP